jgi:hypothetical protein
MKYEAKNNGSGDPISTASSSPWAGIDQADSMSDAAKTVDQSGATVSGAHLISEAEWMTIAANVLSVPSNWSGGAVGSGYIYSGHGDNAPSNALAASTDDTQGYYGETNTGGDQRRTLTLTNGQVIWDFAGNVWEWTQGTITGNQPGSTSDTGYAWHEWTDALSVPFARSGLPTASLPSAISPTAATWNSNQEIGRALTDGADTSARGFLRGGNWYATSLDNGVLALTLSYSPSGSYPDVGFRVAAP